MAIDIDALAVLRAIVATPRIFPNAATETSSFVRKFICDQLKSATTTLDRMREIYRAIGGEAFVLILDGQSDSASAALVKKFDKINPDIKTAPSDWPRRRLAELASGESEPATKPPKTPKQKPKAKKPGLTPEQKELATRLKAKTINLDKARALWLETCEASFTLVLASLTEKLTLGLATKLDKDNPDLKTAPADQLRERIAVLARGAAEPVFKNILENKALEAAQTRTPKVKKPPRPTSSHR
jgi:hypothetical protein